MGGCENFGLPYLSTHNDVLEIGYFPIIGGNGTVPDHDEKHRKGDLAFSAVNACIGAKSLVACAKELAVVWLRQSK